MKLCLKEQQEIFNSIQIGKPYAFVVGDLNPATSEENEFLPRNIFGKILEKEFNKEFPAESVIHFENELGVVERISLSDIQGYLGEFQEIIFKYFSDFLKSM